MVRVEPRLGDAGRGGGTLATAAFGAFLTFLALGGFAVLIRASLAYSVAGELEPGQVLALFHASLVADVLSSIFFGAFAAAVAGATLRTGFLPRGWGWVSVAVALAFVVIATAWSRSGFWSPTGAAIWIMTVVWLLWILVTSVLHFRRVSSAVAQG